MFDFIKKAMLTGVGLAAMTKDKVEEIAHELTEKGKLSAEEGKKLTDDLLKKSEEARKDLEAKVGDLVKKALDKMNVATKDDIAGLAARIEALEKKETEQNE